MERPFHGQRMELMKSWDGHIQVALMELDMTKDGESKPKKYLYEAWSWIFTPRGNCNPDM
jgi:hypothetical protein